MRPWLRLIAAIAALVTVPVLIALAVHHFTPNLFGSANATPLDPSDVKVIGAQSGHGSGVHIGDGFIITAAHVIAQDQAYTIKASSGQVYKATVLWAAKAHDVALMRIEKPRMASSDLDCRPLVVGQAIESRGNPWNLNFVTMRGYVAGSTGTISHWREAAVVDLSIGPGMSGGPVFTGNRVVGINVGVRTAGMGGLTGFGVIVPASAICKLLAR